MNMVDTTRHDAFIDVENLATKQIHIIGLGAIGSPLAVAIARLGSRNLHIWDSDTVEAHNIANQTYAISHIGMTKVKALASIIKDTTGMEVQQHEEEVSKQPLQGIVFTCTDNMKSRNEIFTNCIKYKPQIELFIDSRMGISSCICVVVKSCIPRDIQGWEKNTYSDEEVVAEEVGACRRKVSVGATAVMVAQLATWKLISHSKDPLNTTYPNETVMSVYPNMQLQEFHWSQH